MNTANARPAQARRPRVLLAEDDDELRDLLTFYLEGAEMDVDEVDDGVELLDALCRCGDKYDLVVSDVRMRGLSGVQVLGMTEHDANRPRVLMITAFPDAATERSALALGASAILAKPFELDEFVAIAQMIATRARGLH